MHRRTPLHSEKKRRALRAGALLAPGAPMRSGEARRGAVTEAVRLVLAGKATIAQAARITGASAETVQALVWAEAQRRVFERDSWTCPHCGRRSVVVHDRFSPPGCAAAGVSAVPPGIAALVSLCDEAHRKAHDINDPEMAVRGLRLDRWQDPALVPLILLTGDGTAYPVWLTENGLIVTAPPQRAG
jgi:hypothetical protein